MMNLFAVYGMIDGAAHLAALILIGLCLSPFVIVPVATVLAEAFVSFRGFLEEPDTGRMIPHGHAADKKAGLA